MFIPIFVADSLKHNVMSDSNDDNHISDNEGSVQQSLQDSVSETVSCITVSMVFVNHIVSNHDTYLEKKI